MRTQKFHTARGKVQLKYIIAEMDRIESSPGKGWVTSAQIMIVG